MPGYDAIKEISPAAAQQLRGANNYRYVSNVMRYGGIIRSTGGAVGGMYGREIALIGNYSFLLWV